MQRQLMIGLILLVMSSCAGVMVKEPQPVYVINTKTSSVAKGTKTFNVKEGRDKMTDWVEMPELVEWSEIPENLIAFPLEIWLKKIRPALKMLAQKYKDDRD